MEFKTTGRDGALTKYEISGDAEKARLLVEQAAPGYPPRVDAESDTVRGSNNKSGIAAIRNAVAAYNAKAAKRRAPAQNAGAPRRRVVPAGVYRPGDEIGGFVITGLGRSWYTGGDNSMYGIDPQYQSVQYAYFDGAQ